MPSTKDKKSKNKMLKIGISSDSDSDRSEHELAYHAKDKVKLMKEVLKLIKPKKIKSMAPDCIKNLDIVEINSMLLEELLGISNKRLQYIFNGENVDRETSSSESEEEEKQPVDFISLDDISDDDDIELCVSQNEKASLEPELFKKNRKLKSRKIKSEVVDTAIKLEKTEKSRKENKKKPKKVSELKNRDEDLKETDKDKLMSVLELLELQARARAIRSQLAIESEKKKETESVQNMIIKPEEGSDSDAVIIESPQNNEIIITSSDSEEENCSKISQTQQNHGSSTSELSRLSKHLHSSESNFVPPKKKQKSCITRDWDLSNITKRENKNEDVIVSCSNTAKESKTADRTHTENAEADNKKRKEKLLAKIQKIKLVRNKNATYSSLNTELNNTNEKSNKSIDKECNTKISIETPIVTAETSNINEVSRLHSTADCSGTQFDNKVSCNPENDGGNDQQSNEDVFNENKDAVNDVSARKLKKEMHKTITVSYCDNDEIVINLDEDEMDGIEND